MLFMQRQHLVGGHSRSAATRQSNPFDTHSVHAVTEVFRFYNWEEPQKKLHLRAKIWHPVIGQYTNVYASLFRIILPNAEVTSVKAGNLKNQERITTTAPYIDSWVTKLIARFSVKFRFAIGNTRAIKHTR